MSSPKRTLDRLFSTQTWNAARGPLASEVMLFKVRSNEQIEGIKINDSKVKLSAYADDTYFFALDIWSLLVVLDTCKTFQEFSSLKLNLEKCQACWIGAAKDKSDTPINCNWININHHQVVTLGVFDSYNCSLAEKHNFLNQITSVKRDYIHGSQRFNSSW